MVLEQYFQLCKSIFEQDQENMICTIKVIKDLTIDAALYWLFCTKVTRSFVRKLNKGTPQGKEVNVWL